jgi:putative two-component system response regulator
VADVYDALTSARPYKSAWSPERAKTLMLDECGKQFDKARVAALFRGCEALAAIGQLYQDEQPLTLDKEVA